MKRSYIVTHHLNLVDLLVDVIMAAEPYLEVKLFFKLPEPYLGGTVNIGLKSFFMDDFSEVPLDACILSC